MSVTLLGVFDIQICINIIFDQYWYPYQYFPNFLVMSVLSKICLSFINIDTDTDIFWNFLSNINIDTDIFWNWSFLYFLYLYLYNSFIDISIFSKTCLVLILITIFSTNFLALLIVSEICLSDIDNNILKNSLWYFYQYQYLVFLSLQYRYFSIVAIYRLIKILNTPRLLSKLRVWSLDFSPQVPLMTIVGVHLWKLFN